MLTSNRSPPVVHRAVPCETGLASQFGFAAYWTRRYKTFAGRGVAAIIVAGRADSTENRKICEFIRVTSRRKPGAGLATNEKTSILNDLVRFFSGQLKRNGSVSIENPGRLQTG